MRKYRPYILKSIVAAKLCIEMFNRPTEEHKIDSSLIFLAQAWEFLAKAFLLKKKVSIYKRNRFIRAETAINKLQSDFNKLTSREAQTIQQVISLRNESMHSLIPKIDDEIIIHLLYYSLKTYHKFIKENFRSYLPNFDKNYISIAFKDYTIYSHRVSKLLRAVRDLKSENSRILYLLERGIRFAKNNKELTFEKWKETISNIPKKSRMSKRLSLYEYMEKQENIRIVPIEVSKNEKAEIKITKTKRMVAHLPVHIVKTDPNRDYPFITSFIAEKINKDINFVAAAFRKLKIKGNEDYHISIKTGRSTFTQKYNQKALDFLKDYLKKHSTFWPYK